MRATLILSLVAFAGCASSGAADYKKLQMRVEGLEETIETIQERTNEAFERSRNAEGRVNALEKNYDTLYEEVSKLKAASGSKEKIKKTK